MFQPVNISGAYFPPRATQGAAGILVNSQHPLALRRFTLAHELCHHLRRDAPSIDLFTEDLEFQRHLEDREKMADAFAGYLLMPRRLVNHFLYDVLGAGPSLTPHLVYQVALLLGTSYRATIWQLVNLKILSIIKAREFQQVPPKEIKKALGYYEPKQDTWVVGRHLSGTELSTTEGDILQLELPETPSGGYRWVIDQGAVGNIVADEYVPPAGPQDMVGGRGLRRVRIRIKELGRFTVSAMPARAWQSSPMTEGALTFGVRVAPRIRQGLLQPVPAMAG
jgi:predicted secreted protein